jgi:CSLREA domain-containing protein
MRSRSLFVLNRFTVAALLITLVAASAVQVRPAYAASIVVNSHEDTDTINVNDGKCTLREAITAANLNSPRGGCTAGSVGVDTISFTADYTITVGSQLPFVTTAMTITGKGAANTIIQAAATPNTATWRVFQVTGPTPTQPHSPLGDLTLDGVTVRHGRCEGSCTSHGGIDPNSGGGIYNGGTLTVKNSSISNNVAVGGGGIWNGGTLIVNTSTISGNTTTFSDGAGILNMRGTVTVTNSTFAGNIAYEDGAGALVNGDHLTVTNSTISGNTGFGAGGIFNDGIAFLKNTIVANNTGGNCAGQINDWGNNLQFGGGVADSCGWGHSSSGSLSNADPLLGMLANNGGPTKTMALQPGSPAIDAGNDANCPTTDQRGGARPQGSHCDIGAYESGAPVTYISTFSDVPDNYWALTFIDRLYEAGITGGCSTTPLNYCPDAIVTRDQMAVFLLRGIHGSSYNPPGVGGSTGFGDVSTTYWAAAWIKQLAVEGITGGCGGGNYCPTGAVTRDQIAVFLLKAKHGSSYAPPLVGDSTGFGDVPTTYWAAAWIKQLAAEGITGGCSAGAYCPGSPVTRAQMAVFLVRTFNLP